MLIVGRVGTGTASASSSSSSVGEAWRDGERGRQMRWRFALGEEEFWDADRELLSTGRFLEIGAGCESGITLGGVFHESACTCGRGVSFTPSAPMFPIFGWISVHGVLAISILMGFLVIVSGMKAGVV